MPRAAFALLVAVVSLLGAGLACAGEDDPTLRGVKLSEWLERLKGDKEANLRPVFLLAVGSPGHRAIEDILYRSRRGGLLAVELIGPKRSRKVFPAILSSLREDADPRLREGAAQALGRLSAKVAKETTKQRLTEVRDGLVTALRSDKAGAVRQAAATALGQVDPESKEYHLVHDLNEALPVLVAAVKDSDVGASNAAAETLRKMGKDAGGVVPEIVNLLKDRKIDGLSRTLLAQALGKIGSPDAVPALPALKEALADAKAPLDVRRSAAESIGNLGKDATESIELLATILIDSSSEVDLRRSVAAALDQFGPDARSALPSLKKAIRDNDKFVRCLVMHTMGQMGRELGDETRDVITLLLKALDDPVIEVRVAALETFGNLGQEALGADAKTVIERVAELTKDSRKDVREGAENALKKLKAM